LEDGKKIKGTTDKDLDSLANALLGCSVSGWLSPKKLLTLLAAAGTVNHYGEQIASNTFNKAGMTKFKLFEDETAVDGASDKLLGEQPAAPAMDLPQY
jgi:hypothetical protein